MMKSPQYRKKTMCENELCVLLRNSKTWPQLRNMETRRNFYMKYPKSSSNLKAAASALAQFQIVTPKIMDMYAGR